MINSYNLLPIVGCRGCEGTAGRLGCPTHSPNVYVQDFQPVKPFVQLFIACPWCGKHIKFDGFKVRKGGPNG